MKKIYIVLIVTLLESSAGFSQAFWTINYDIGVPSGEFSDFIGKPSWRGYSINGNQFITDNIMLGGMYHWSGYAEHFPRDTYQLVDGALTAEIWKKMYFNKFHITSNYIFSTNGRFQPYLGLGLGAYYMEKSVQTGLYSSNKKNLKLGLAPDAGLYIPVGEGDMGVNIKVNYNTIFYNGDVMNILSYLYFSVGIGMYSW